MKNDGGPAFPCAGSPLTGMSLRDWFAGQVLAGQIAYEGAEGCGGDEGPNDVAQWCYALADAMLEERNKKRTV